MQIIEKYANVFSFYRAKHSLIIIIRDEAKKEQDAYILGSGKKMRTKSLWHFGDYVYDMRTDKFLVYDDEFNHLFDLNKKGINAGNSSIDYIDEKILILGQSVLSDDDTSTSFLTYYENLEEKATVEFCGKVLNKKYRLNLKKEEQFSYPTYFRLSNILDTKTYFEFKCEKGYELLKTFYIWNDSLIFMYYKETELILEQRVLETGKTIWKTHIQSGRFCFDKKSGIMASIWGKSGMYDDSTDQYQIVNLNSQTVEVGSPIKDFEFTQVESHMGTFLYENKLYFSDNPFSYSGKEPNAPLVGCFNIETKKIDFIQKIPEMAGSTIAEIIYNDKLFVRSSNGDLIVYEI